MLADFSASRIFGPDGKLAATLPEFEYRQEQETMAAAVWQTLCHGNKLAIEAGTGVGKSLAYLVPAAVWATRQRRRVVVSTYTHLLQHQLLSRDVPLALSLIDEPPPVSIAYGQDNYLCQFRLKTQLGRGLFDSREEAARVEQLINWATATNNGIILNYPDILPPSVQRRVTRDSGACRRERCPYRQSCWYWQARTEWDRSGIIITNHSPYFASVAGSADILPEHAAVVFDEAHRLEEACVRHFGTDLSQRTVEQVLDDISVPGQAGLSRLLPTQSALRRDIDAAVVESRKATQRFFLEAATHLPQGQERTRLIQPLASDEPGQVIGRLAALLTEAASKLDDELLAAEFAGVARRLNATATAFAAFASFDTENSVYWADAGAPENLAFVSAPLNVAPMLKSHIYDREIPTILTSATLTVAGSFDFFQSRLGVTEFQQIRLDSPFDYTRNSLLLIPSRIPPPTSGTAFICAAAKTIKRILDCSDGRAMVLFTSYDMLNAVRTLMPKTKYAVLCQGEQPTSRLLAEFQQDIHSVLFATQSFWQGVDVPGESLSCLIICRLPFEVPDDPRLTAIAEKLRQEGIDPFTVYQLPTAALRFRQGFGRLIRSTTDRGVVCVLNRRITDRPYGRVFLNSLPSGIPVTFNITDIRDFFRHPDRLTKTVGHLTSQD